MRVCVVGAGVSGLPSIKACLEEGLEVVCYEKTADLGGLWNYRPDQEDVGATVMETTVVNTSKEMMAYSDFPPPADWANFMHHTKVNEYLHMYADAFDLEKHIQFNTAVSKIEKTDSGGWYVSLSNGHVDLFNRVILCTGHHATPQQPTMKNQDQFKGNIMHAWSYRNSDGFKGKDVFLVGIGNSSLDIAVDLAKVAKSVTISTRRGTWIFNRCAQGGMPYDTQLMTRYYDFIIDTIPWTVANDFMEHRCQMRMDHDLYGLRPNHRFFQQHPTVNDALANLICSGYVTITEDVEELRESSVIVKSGREFSCDVLIFCTGYTFDFPYLSEGTISMNNHEVDLYKFVFPPNDPTVSVIGLIQPIGSIAPIAEMQARWVAASFSGSVSLPKQSAMLDDIAHKRRLMKRRYFNSTKHTIQVDYVKYMDEIAEILGCKPNLREIFWKDPKFGVQLFMGPNLPYVYRLIGPHSWPLAEKYIRTVAERVKQPLKNRQCRIRRHKKRGTTQEYFRFASMKWIAGWTVVLLSAGLLWYGSALMTIPVYFVPCVVFFSLFAFLLLWFDLQYDMTTIL